MQSSSRSSYIFPRSAKLIATKVRKRRLREAVAAWVLMLALALVVTVAAIWLSKWLDENAKQLSSVFLAAQLAPSDKTSLMESADGRVATVTARQERNRDIGI